MMRIFCVMFRIHSQPPGCSTFHLWSGVPWSARILQAKLGLREGCPVIDSDQLSKFKFFRSPWLIFSPLQSLLSCLLCISDQRPIDILYTVYMIFNSSSPTYIPASKINPVLIFSWGICCWKKTEISMKMTKDQGFLMKSDMIYTDDLSLKLINTNNTYKIYKSQFIFFFSIYRRRN